MDDLRFHELWQKWQNQDNEDGQELLVLCAAQLNEYVARRLPSYSICNQTSPESITQNVFVGLLRAQKACRFPTFSAFWAYLRQAANHALVTEQRRWNTESRGKHLTLDGDFLEGVFGNWLTPSQQCSLLELYEEVRWRFTPQECWLADQVAGKNKWPEIAGNDHAEQDRLRNLLRKAFSRVAVVFASDLQLPEEESRGIDPQATAHERLQNLYNWVVQQEIAEDQYAREHAEQWQWLHDEALTYLTTAEETVALQRVQGLSWADIALASNKPNVESAWRQAFHTVSHALDLDNPLLVKSAYEWIEWQKARQHE
jgi:hypothetical protein